MEFDGYAPSLGVAFEYHGEQHYRRSASFHRNARVFKQRQRDDEQKRRLCRRRKVILLEVPYRIPHEQLQEYLADLLDRANLGVICDRTPIKITELEAWRRKDCEELQALAASRGGRVLSDYYINGVTKLRWRCAEGHDWEAIPDSIKRGTWCPTCGDRRAATKRALTIERMRVTRRSKGWRLFVGELRQCEIKAPLALRCRSRVGNTSIGHH
jgi:hypothetical protein